MKFKIGDKVKILDVGGNMHSNDSDFATTWEPHDPFNRTLSCDTGTLFCVFDYSGFMIEIENGDQYIISKRGLEKIDNFLTDDLFEI